MEVSLNPVEGLCTMSGTSGERDSALGGASKGGGRGCSILVHPIGVGSPGSGRVLGEGGPGGGSKSVDRGGCFSRNLGVLGWL